MCDRLMQCPENCATSSGTWTWTLPHGTVEAPVSRRCRTMEEQNRAGVTGEACPDCHALVSDLDAHKRWHSRLVADLANAVENEIKRS